MLKPRLAKRLIIVAGTLVLVLIINHALLGDAIQNIAYNTLKRPGVFVQTWLAKIATYSNGILHIATIINQNNALQIDHDQLLSSNAQLDSLQRENDLLRGQLGSSPRLKQKIILAHVFDRQHSAVASTIMIDQGSDEGIQKSMAVIQSGNVLLGMVDTVFSHTARVILVDDPRSQISVRIQGTDIVGTMKTIAGSSETAQIDLITSQDDVKEGGLIATSGLDNLPQSLIVGVVKSVVLTGGNLFKSVVAQLYGNNLTDPLVFVVEVSN